MCRLFDIKIDFDLANVFQKYLVVYSDLLIGIVVGGAGGTSRQSESTGEWKTMGRSSPSVRPSPENVRLQSIGKRKENPDWLDDDQPTF